MTRLIWYIAYSAARKAVRCGDHPVSHALEETYPYFLFSSRFPICIKAARVAEMQSSYRRRVSIATGLQSVKLRWRLLELRFDREVKKNE